MKISAYQIAEEIDIKKFNKDFSIEPDYYSPSELFYVPEKDKFILLLSYGVVVFAGFDEVKITERLKLISQYCENLLEEKIFDDFTINYEENQPDRIGYNEISVSKFNNEIVKLVLFYLGQSVALDFYTKISEKLLEESRVFTTQLEKLGKIKISSKKLQMFIGKTMNIKNKIIDNLYIMDSPEETWEDEYLNKIDHSLKKIFDIKLRFRDLDDNLKIVKENLDLFKDLLQHNHSSFLEWIIIGLILIEVFNLFWEKITKLFLLN